MKPRLIIKQGFHRWELKGNVLSFTGDTPEETKAISAWFDQFKVTWRNDARSKIRAELITMGHAPMEFHKDYRGDKSLLWCAHCSSLQEEGGGDWVLLADCDYLAMVELDPKGE